MSSSVVSGLRAQGVDTLTALDAGMVQRLDEDHLWFAAQRGRTLYSFNLGDYYRIHTHWLTANAPHGGLILAQQRRYSVGEQLRRLLRLIGSISEEMKDRVEFLSSWG